MCLLISLPSDVAEPGGSDLPSAPATSPPLGPGLSSPDSPPSDWPVLVGRPELLAWSELDGKTEEKKQIKKKYSFGRFLHVIAHFDICLLSCWSGLDWTISFTSDGNSWVITSTDLYYDIIELLNFKFQSHGHNLRSTQDTLALQIPQIRTKVTLGDRSFFCAAPRLWNKLPVDIRKSQTLESFNLNQKWKPICSKHRPNFTYDHVLNYIAWCSRIASRSSCSAVEYIYIVSALYKWFIIIIIIIMRVLVVVCALGSYSEKNFDLKNVYLCQGFLYFF